MTSLIRTLVAGTVIASALSAPVVAQSPQWTAGGPGRAEFDIVRDSAVVHGGRTSIRIHADDEPTAFVTINTGVAAQPYHGRRIRYSMFLRSESLRGGGGQLWARADDAAGRTVGFINSQSIFAFRGTNDWKQLSVALDVPSGATQLIFGVVSAGAGTLWMDDAHLEAEGTAPIDAGFETLAEFTPPPKGPKVLVTREAPRALTARGLANLSAFTSALGYVRFFYPTAKAVTVNWDELAVRGVRAVEKAPTPDSLASALAAIFSPIGPDLRFATSEARLPSTISKPVNATHAVYWRHLGVGAPSGGASPTPQNLYRSERLAVPLSSVGHPVAVPAGVQDVISLPNVPDPAKPLHVSLDGGVMMSIPTALFTSESTIPDALQRPQPPRTTERLVAADRGTRLADVALAWSLFEHFYPYFAVAHTDWPAARTSALQSAATDTNAASFQITLERLVAKLRDGHGGVYSSSTPTLSPDVRLGWAEGRVFVTAIGDSAASSGVHVGDEVLGIDDRPVGAVIDAQSEHTSGATAQWIRSRVLGSLLAGEPGSTVRLKLADATGKARDVSIRRSSASVNDKSINKIAEVGPGVMYVDLGRITDADFNAALSRLEAARSIIFDMRGYPRQVNTPTIFAHLTDSVIHSAHFKIPVITEPRYRNVGFVDGAWTISPSAPRLKARVVFLSGGGAISYAESTLGVVEAYKLGDIIGEPSAGTNGNVNPFMLPGGYNVTWTGMLVEKRDGTPHHGVGVVPTIPVSPTAAGMRAGKDDVLERAIALVSPRPLTP